MSRSSLQDFFFGERLIFASLLMLTVCVGCGPSTGVVSGEVTYQGKPIPGGYLTFRPAQESANSVTFTLERDGKFRVELPVGEVRVCLDNREFEPSPPVTPPQLPGMNLPPEVRRSIVESAGASGRVSDRWVKIPEKYYLIETSGLDFKVEGRDQTFNIELKD